MLDAMRRRKQVVCVYQGHVREVCPVILGRTGLEEKALDFQFGGRTSEGPVTAPGQWKCLRLSLVEGATLRPGPWHAGTAHSTDEVCMKMVEYDVNPDSPYNPVFRL
jgi:hypothetical protein